MKKVGVSVAYFTAALILVGSVLFALPGTGLSDRAQGAIYFVILGLVFFLWAVLRDWSFPRLLKVVAAGIWLLLFVSVFLPFPAYPIAFLISLAAWLGSCHYLRKAARRDAQAPLDSNDRTIPSA